ncbi:MAG: histidine kinase [Muribaculaceae bacterium]|nr:histidine kinase [Muribaculaceae bacterium]
MNNDNNVRANFNVRSNFAETATVVLLAFLLFYFPSMLAILTKGDEPWGWIMWSIAMATSYTAVFCLNYFWIVPATLFRSDRKFLFFITNIVLILFTCSLIPLWFETHGGLPHPKHLANQPFSIGQYLMNYLKVMIRDGIMMIFAVALAYALRLSKEHENMRRRQLELDAERRQIELKSLKAQLNPHFLFNSLNNIYALISISPERAQKALLDLSSMLRFMIYDAASAYVPIDKEIKFITDYVELMKLRLSSSIRLECHIPVLNVSDMAITPLIFLTLVENAFKHVDNSDGNGFISISINADDKWVACHVENSCAPDDQDRPVSMTNSGVGLSNIERQLRLIYPATHTMSLQKSGNVFSAEIRILSDALRQGNPFERQSSALS